MTSAWVMDWPTPVSSVEIVSIGFRAFPGPLHDVLSQCSQGSLNFVGGSPIVLLHGLFKFLSDRSLWLCLQLSIPVYSCLRALTSQTDLIRLLLQFNRIPVWVGAPKLDSHRQREFKRPFLMKCRCKST